MKKILKQVTDNIRLLIAEKMLMWVMKIVPKDNVQAQILIGFIKDYADTAVKWQQQQRENKEKN